MINKLQNEWAIFKSDFKKIADDSLLFRINWYILKPIAIILAVVAFVII